MSAKQSRPKFRGSAYHIAPARKLLKTMPMSRKLEIMFESRLITAEQLEIGKRKLAEMAAAEVAPAQEPTPPAADSATPLDRETV